MAATTPKWLKITLGIVVGVALLIGVLAYVGRNAMLGTKFAYSEKESIYYSGSATEAEAKSLGDALKTSGYFSGSKSIDVLLSKGTGGTVLSFVVQDGFWDKAEFVAGMQTLGRDVAPAIGGLPLTVRMIDSALKTRHEDPVK